MTIDEIRQKYPQYNDLSDYQIAKPLYEKNYSDMKFSDFADKIGADTRIGFWEAAAEDWPEKLPFSPVGLIKNIALYTASRRMMKNSYKPEVTEPQSTGMFGYVPMVVEKPVEQQKQEDKELLDRYIKETNKRMERGYSFLGNVGQSLSILPAWMIEFAATGGLKAIGTKAATSLAKKITERQLAQKAAGWLGGAALRTTVGMPHRYLSPYIKKRLPQIQQDESGNLNFTPTTQNWATDFAKSWGAAVIESASEEAGETITKVGGKLLNKLPFGKQFADGLFKLWKKVKPKGTKTAFINQMFKKGGYSNFLGEIGEERLATLMHAIAGTQDFGAGPDANVFQRLSAGLTQDWNNFPVELITLAVPGASRFGAGKISQFVQDTATKADISPDDALKTFVADSMKKLDPDAPVEKQREQLVNSTLDKLAELQNKKVIDLDTEDIQWAGQTVGQLFTKETKPAEEKSIEPVEEKPPRQKLTYRRALIQGHKLAKQLGMTENERQGFMEELTGKTSMKDMTADERRLLINELEQRAVDAGVMQEKQRTQPGKPIMLGRKITTMEDVIDQTIDAANNLRSKIKIPKHITRKFVRKQKKGIFKKFAQFAVGIDNSPIYQLINALEQNKPGILTDVFVNNIRTGQKIEAGHKRGASEMFNQLREEAEITDEDLMEISASTNPRLILVQMIQGAYNKGVKVYKVKINNREYDMTGAELIEMYLVAQQEGRMNEETGEQEEGDGVRHLLNGGAKIKGVKTGAMSEQQLNDILSIVENNPRLKSLVDILTKIGEEYWAPSINAVSNALEGKDTAVIKKWWGMEIEKPRKLGGKGEKFNINFLENKSIFKDRTDSVKPVVIRDALARFTGFENAIAEYVGMASPTRIARTVLNDETFSEIINDKGYGEIRNNIFTILERAQSVPTSQGAFDKFFSKILPGIYRSLLFFNPRVIMSQYTSVTNYGAFVSGKYMVLVKDGISVEAAQETLALSNLAWDRFYMGHSSLELGEAASSDATLRFLTKTSSDKNKMGVSLRVADISALAGGMKISQAEYDDAQNGTISGESALYWAGKDVSFEKGSQEWKQAVTDRAEFLWQRSQPSWDKWNRSVITSDPAGTRRLFFLFRSFHEKSLTILQNAQTEYNNSDKSMEAKGRWATKYGAVLSGYALNTILRALIMVGIARRIKEPIEYLTDIITAPFAMLPILGKILQTSLRSFINVLSDNPAEYRGQAVESLPIKIVNTIANAPPNFSRAAAYFIAGDTVKAERSLKQALGQIYKGVGTAYGTPVSEMNRFYEGWLEPEEIKGTGGLYGD